MRIGGTFGIDLSASHSFLRANKQIDLSSVRLSTMQRINSASDDPAGLIMAEQIRAELSAINAAADSAARAGAVVRTADSALGQVSSLLDTVHGNVVAGASGGRSEAELSALQMESDAALEAINLIGHTTSFGGEKLFDGGEMAFALSPDVGNASTVSLPVLSTSALGGSAGLLNDLASGGSASLAGGDLTMAVEILDAASSQVLRAQASLGSFEKYTIGSAMGVLNSMQENLSAAFSQVFDTNVAEETSRAARSQLLASASITSALLSGQSRSQLAVLV